VDDQLNRAQDGRNWVEKIADRLPGFSGYQNRETRREIDRTWRGHLARRVDDVRQTLSGKIREISGKGDLDGIAGLDGAGKALDGLANRIRTADSGYSGFFDAVKVGIKELEAVYRFDLDFDDSVAALARSVESFGSAAGPDAAQLRHEVEAAQIRWKQRADLLDLAMNPGG